MQLSLVVLAASFGAALAAPSVSARQNACFIVGNTVLPKEVSDAAASLANKVTCDASKKTLSGVPDVDAGGVKFSAINFAASSQTPLAFALDKFATKEPLADNDLATFQNQVNAYTATEAGIRSVGGNFAAIKIPKFFLAMQISRIQTAQGNPPKDAGQQVDHLRDKVIKNSPREAKALIDQVTALAAKTS
ncbi:hypothetical protein LY78DRAFT_657780 [Colletotrichum sublineola]|uniref:DUF7143 domain-containing protein n=1 Tax=Colletotrichum sublineola TaxID=1173701 RepID=A0A066XWP2_COLSU|nr:hypothetical protein LY78DRAFT_657780 [Colletotrichum sublineola]KDN70390.1 hypothetical protein CSUB01_07629 [Colletotrichum sublineola]